MREDCFIIIHDQKLVLNAGGQWFHYPSDAIDLVRTGIQMDIYTEQDRCYKAVSLDTYHDTDRLIHFRQIIDRVSPEESLAISRALQLITWHKQHQFCGQCGRPTTQHPSENALACMPCQLNFYPRISPCMMCLVTRDDHCLLAHHHRQVEGMYSTLAGFVEAGENLERTVHREVMEEVGLKVKKLRYYSSQSWPFPHQLMMGFFAEYESGEIRLEEEEIEDARWFRYDQLPRVPSIGTLSGQLIKAFVLEQSNH